MEAFSISPSGRGRLKRELHIVQRWAVSSGALGETIWVAIVVVADPGSGNNAVDTCGSSIVGKEYIVLQ